MATKQSASKSKKTTKKTGSTAGKTTTRVSSARATSARRSVSQRLGFNRSPVIAGSIAEFVGTFLLASVVLASSGSAIIVFFGLLAIALAVGVVSGSYLNPALTIGAWVTRRINSVRALSYVVAQVLGAVLALVVVNGYVLAAPEISEQAASFGQQAPAVFVFAELVSGKEWLILGAELLGTAIFAFVVAAVTRERNRVVSALGIAGGLFLGLAVAGYLANVVGATGAVLNPAIAGSVQALSWDLWAILVFVLAPVVGAIIGFGLQDLLSDETVA